MRKHVLCLGNIAYDLILKEKSDIDSFSAEIFPGGSMYNTAILLSKLGCPVKMIAKTGKNFLGDHLVKTLRKYKVSTSFVAQKDTVQTALAIARINKKGDSSYLFYRSGPLESTMNDIKIPEAVLRNTGVLHTGSAFTYSNDVTFDDTLSLLIKAKKYGVFTTYDPNWRQKRIKDPKKAIRRIFKLLEYIDLVKLSDTDAFGITEAKTLSAALKRLPANTIVTLGQKGAFHKRDMEKTFTPGFKVKVSDTIGAGDAFSAGLICRYLENGPSCLNADVKQTLRFSAAVAALVCTSSGATGGLKNIRQVMSFIRSYT